MAERFDRYLAKYGAATVIALFLVWWMASDVSGSLHSLRTMLESHVSETNFYLRAICLNTSQNEAQRASCIPPERR